MSGRIAALSVCLFIVLWSVTNSSVDETIQIRVSNPNFSVSDKFLKQLLQAANLTGRGYRKIFEKKSETDFDTGRPVYQETWRFLKQMLCSEVAAAEEKLNQLLPGVFGAEVKNTVKHEILKREIESVKTCIAGVEFHFKEHLGCQLRRARRDINHPCDGCTGCQIIIVNP